MREIDYKVKLGVVQSQVLHKENFIAIIILSNSTYLVNYLFVIRGLNLLYPTKNAILVNEKN